MVGVCFKRVLANFLIDKFSRAGWFSRERQDQDPWVLKVFFFKRRSRFDKCTFNSTHVLLLLKLCCSFQELFSLRTRIISLFL